MLIILNQVKEIDKTLAKYKGSLLIDYKIFVRLSAIIETYIITNHSSELKKELKQFDTYKVKFAYYGKEELEDSIALKSIFESTEPINYGLKHRFHSLLDDKHSKKLREQTDTFKQENQIPPIVTFYSYKGGMGRTTTMNAYALHLALHHGLKVIVMDFDLEAPGYLNFFNLGENKDLENGEINGIVEYLMDSQFSKNPSELSLNKYYIQLEEQHTGEKGEIFIFPAGNLSGSDNQKDYLQGLARLDLASEDRFVDTFRKLFKRMKDELKPDIILIDSRTGFNDVYGMMALIMSDGIVGFFGSSKQTIPGLELLLDKVERFPSLDLLLINSILPANEARKSEWHAKFVNFVKALKGEAPNSLPLSRYEDLENIGLLDQKEIKDDNLENTGSLNQNEIKELVFTNLVRDKQLPDLEAIFQRINHFEKVKPIFPQIAPNLSNRELRINILKTLKEELPKTFAEDEQLEEHKFFYRKSMYQIFDKKKFIIQGFKGTGKTYLYKALKDSKMESIQKELQRRAGKQDENFVYVDVISEKGKNDNKLYDFDSLRISEIQDKSYYFKSFWVVYTWNALMLDAEKIGFPINVSPALKAQIKEIRPDTETAQRFNKIIYDTDLLIEIEKQLEVLNQFLESKQKNLVILYDQLDNLIKPEKWSVIASPLVEYWWNKMPTFSRFFPKIFIRTDLFNRTTGTNTQRLLNNIVSIEWTKDEVYAYFFKIVFASANGETKNQFFKLIEQNGLQDNFSEVQGYLDNLDNKNQVIEDEIYLRPLMTVFFGEVVKGGRDAQGLGHPYQWFYTNLTNADQKSISLRPFINLIKAAVNDAVNADTDELPIINSVYYANMQNRDEVVETHFRDLIREEFNKDLEKVFEYLKQQGSAYKYIFLTRNELHAFLKEVITYYGNTLESQNEMELISLLEANGIINRVVKHYSDIYYFPQLYKYWLGLKNRKDSDVIDQFRKGANENTIVLNRRTSGTVSQINTNKSTNTKTLKEGDWVNCIITGFHSNGKTVFVAIENSEERASIYVKELDDSYIRDVREFEYEGQKLQVNQTLTCRIIRITSKGIELSLRKQATQHRTKS